MVSEMCTLCNSPDEVSVHIFLKCEVATQAISKCDIDIFEFASLRWGSDIVFSLGIFKHGS